MTPKRPNPESEQLTLRVVDILSMSGSCSPSIDGNNIEVCKAQLLNDLVLDLRNQQHTRTILGARVIVARAISESMHDYEGFPAYDRAMVLHDGLLGPGLSVVHSIRSAYHVIRANRANSRSVAC